MIMRTSKILQPQNTLRSEAQGDMPILVFGQDEAIYNQNSSNIYQYQWVGPNDERPLFPKNSGMGTTAKSRPPESRETGCDKAVRLLYRVQPGLRYRKLQGPF